MPLFRRILVVAVLADSCFAWGFGQAPAVHACSCVAPMAPESEIGANDIAFVGRPVAERAAPIDIDDFGVDGLVYTMQVDTVLRGDLPDRVDVYTSGNSGSCGITLAMGIPVGIATSARDERYEVGSCGGVIDAAAALAAPRSLPPPTGAGPLAAVVAGRWGAANLIGLDAHGEPLAYGFGTWHTDATALSACPGGHTLAALGFDWRDPAAASGEPPIVLRLYDLPSLEQTAEQAIEVNVPNAATHAYPTAFRCLAEDGSSGAILTSGAGSANVGVLTRWGTNTQSISLGQSFGGAIGPDAAYVVEGDTIVRVDMSTGEFTAVTQLPEDQAGRDVALTADESSAVVIAGKADQPPYPFAADRLVTVALATGTVVSSVDIPAVNSPKMLASGSALIVRDMFTGEARIVQPDGALGPVVPGVAFAELEAAGVLAVDDFQGNAVISPTGEITTILSNVARARAATTVSGGTDVDPSAVALAPPETPATTTPDTTTPDPVSTATEESAPVSITPGTAPPENPGEGAANLTIASDDNDDAIARWLWGAVGVVFLIAGVFGFRNLFRRRR